MAQTLFEQNGGTYIRQGDYCLPDVKLPEQQEYEIGVSGNRRRQYLKQHHRIKYYNMLTQCTLYPHLADVEQQAQRLYLKLIEDFSKAEGVTEKLKETDSMLWVDKMNAISNSAMEIVNNEVIYL